MGECAFAENTAADDSPSTDVARETRTRCQSNRKDVLCLGRELYHQDQLAPIDGSRGNQLSLSRARNGVPSAAISFS